MFFCVVCASSFEIVAFVLQNLVADMSRITHSHPDAILGAQLECAAVHAALHLKVSCFSYKEIELSAKINLCQLLPTVFRSIITEGFRVLIAGFFGQENVLGAALGLAEQVGAKSHRRGER